MKYLLVIPLIVSGCGSEPVAPVINQSSGQVNTLSTPTASGPDCSKMLGRWTIQTNGLLVLDIRQEGENYFISMSNVQGYGQVNDTATCQGNNRLVTSAGAGDAVLGESDGVIHFRNSTFGKN